MSIDVHTIGVGVETKEVTTATRELDKFGKSADTASRKADGLTKESEKLNKSTSSLRGSFGALQSLLPIVGFGALASAVIRASDSYTKFNAQLKIATTSQVEYNKATQNVIEIANRSQASVAAIGTTYARITNSLRELGATQEQVSKTTETLSLSLKVNGVTTEEASSTMLQLSQAFGKGKLDGDEFRTAMEAAPNVMRALAQSMGVPFGTLKDLAAQGQITSEVMLKAFTDQKLLDGLRAQAEETRTISGAWQEVKNSIGLAIGKLIEYIDLRNKVNENADLFVQAFSPGGLLGGDTEYQKITKLREREAQLKKELRYAEITLANRGNAPDIRSKLRSVQQELLNLSPNTKATTPSGSLQNYSIAQNFNIAPNFQVNKKNGTGGYDARENNSKQIEDAARKSKEYQEQIDKVTTDRKLRAIEQEYDSRATKMANHLDAIAKQVDIEKAADIEKQERLKVYMEYQQKLANENFKEAQTANKKLEDERLKEFEKTTDAINNIFREGFAGLVNGGKNSWKAFTKSLATTFKTTVADQIYKLFAQPFVVKLVASVLGIGVSGASSASSLVASSGSSGSLSSVFGGLKDIISAGNGSIVSSIESLGTFLSTGTGGLGDTLGGFIGQYSQQIADVLPYAGAFMQLLSGDIKGAALTGIGTAIGSIWGPIGGAIGGMLGSLAGGLFGGGHVTRNKYYANSNVSDTGASLINAYGNSDAGYSNQALAGTSNNFGNIILTYAKAFGASVDKFVLGVNYQQKYDTYALSLGNQIAYNGTNADFQFKTPDIENGIAQAFLIAIKKGFVNLPEYIQSILNKSTLDVASAKENLQIVAQIKTIYDSLNDLPPVFDAIKYALENTTKLDTVDKLKAQFSGVQTYTNLFYTESEKFDTFTKQLTTQLGALNETLPTSRDEYRALVDSFNVVDLATQAQFDSLVALAPAMDEYFKQLQSQKDIVEETTGALRDLNSFTSLAEYRQYKGVSANYGATFALDNTANYRSGNLSNSLSGQGVATGDTSKDVVSLLKELRDYMKQNVIAATNSADLLDRFDRAGMPARA